MKVLVCNYFKMNIKNFQQLCKNVLGFEEAHITGVLSKKSTYYTHFQMPKKNGFRDINAISKDSELYRIQRKLVDNFLSTMQLPIAVKGFIPKGSYYNFLETHMGSKYFIRIDINNFFDSITRDLFDSVFGSELLIDEDEKIKCLDLIWELCTLENRVPQGAVTSPMLSNFLFSRIDQRITKYGQSVNVKYTRYADDLLFSSESFNLMSNDWFIKKIRYILLSQGFKINYSKLKRTDNFELGLNGFVISKNEIRISRNRMSKIKFVIFHINKNITVLNSVNGEEKLLNIINNLVNQKYAMNFEKFGNLTMYLLGYRAFLIDWIKEGKTESQLRIKNSIACIETIIKTFER